MPCLDGGTRLDAQEPRDVQQARLRVGMPDRSRHAQALIEGPLCLGPAALPERHQGLDA